MHVAKLTHRLAMHFAERLKKPQEGVNLLKVSHPVYFSNRECHTQEQQTASRNLSASAAGAYQLLVRGWGA